MRYLFGLFTLLFILTGCSIKQIDTSNVINKEEFSLMYSRGLYYDEPTDKIVFEGLSKYRPSSGSFKILYFKDQRLIMSFDIDIVDQNQANMKNPIRTIKTYTSNGFKVGVQMIKGDSSNQPAVLLVPVVTSIGGFVIGVIASTADMLEELKDSIIIDNAEVLNYYRIYNYDENNELKNITQRRSKI